MGLSLNHRVCEKDAKAVEYLILFKANASDSLMKNQGWIGFCVKVFN